MAFIKDVMSRLFGDGNQTTKPVCPPAEGDPYKEIRQRRQQEYEELERRLSENETPIVAELRKLGYDIESVYEIEQYPSYPDAISVLLRHLQGYNKYDRRVRATIARALNCPEVRQIIPEVIEAFRKDPTTTSNSPKWILGDILCDYYADKYVDGVIELALDASHGPARNRLVYALAKSKRPEAAAALDQLRSDPDLSMHVEVIDERRRKAKRRKPPVVKKYREAAKRIKPKKLKETSVGFDLEQAGPLFTDLYRIIDAGFSEKDSTSVRKIITAMKEQEEEALGFEVVYQGRKMPLLIHVTKSDFDAVEIEFFSREPMINAISEKLNAILD